MHLAVASGTYVFATDQLARYRRALALDPTGESLSKEQLEERLQFFHTVARLWRAAARPEIWTRGDSNVHDTISGWLRTARRNRAHLARFLDNIKDVPVPEPIGGSRDDLDKSRGLPSLPVAVQ